MSRKMKELQSLVNERAIALNNAERKIEEMNIVIANLEKQINSQYNDKRMLRKENAEQKEFITKFTKLVLANKYNNEKVILGKIKELVTDYQSNN